MIYLVKYYEGKIEFTDLITRFDLENYTKVNEFHQIQKVNNYLELKSLLVGCKVEYENINYLLEIGKDALLIVEHLS